MAHREAIEKHLFEQVTELFGLAHTVTLYDLTNTFFEGEAADQPKAQRGHSKEKRSDCALLTLGLVLDGSGFVRRSRSVCRQGRRRQDAGADAQGPARARRRPGGDGCGDCHRGQRGLVADNGYRYLVVSRQRTRRMTPSGPSPSRPGRTTRFTCTRWWMRTAARCGCTVIPRSAPKRRKGSPDASPSASRASYGSSTRGCRGPAPARGSTLSGSGSGGSRSAAAVPGSITPWTSSSTRAAARQWVTWSTSPLPAPCSPASRCLLSTLQCPRLGSADLVAHLHHAHRSRSRVPDQVRTRLRPIFHKTQNRSDGHLFITVIAYQLVQTIRRRLAEHGENASWTTLRRILQGQHRVTASFRRKDGHPPRPQGTRAEQPSTQNLHRSRSSTPHPEVSPN